MGSTAFTFNITVAGTYNVSVLTSDGRTLTVRLGGIGMPHISFGRLLEGVRFTPRAQTKTPCAFVRLDLSNVGASPQQGHCWLSGSVALQCSAHGGHLLTWLGSTAVSFFFRV